MEQLHYRLMIEIKTEILSFSVLLLQTLVVFFMKLNKKVEKRHSLLAKDGLQGSQIHCKNFMERPLLPIFK
jgi:hypothetical protein